MRELQWKMHTRFYLNHLFFQKIYLVLKGFEKLYLLNSEAIVPICTFNVDGTIMNIKDIY